MSIRAVDDSMHASCIRQDATDHIPQVMSNMKRFKSTIKPSLGNTPSLELQDTTSTDNDEKDTDIGEQSIDIYIDDDFNRLDIKQRKNKNIISLKKYQTLADIDNKKQKQSNECNCCCKNCHKKLYNKCCYSVPILHPHGNLRIAWDCIIMIILIYTCVEIPYTMAFSINLTLEHTFGIIALSIDCLLLVDVLLNFRTAYFDEFDQQMLVYNPQRIAWKYLTTWFCLDFITSVPFEFLIPAESAGNFPSLIKILRIFRMVRLLKLLRFFRMLKTFNSIIASFMTRSIIIVAKLFKLLCLMTLSAHFVACLWFYVGMVSYQANGAGNSWLYPDADDDSSSMLDLSNSEQYLTSFYFAVVTLYTTGYGDITPKSMTEKLTCSACILVGTCFFAYFIGAVGALVADGDRVKCAQIQKVEEAQAFCASKKLPAPVAHALMSHAKYHWHRNFVFDDMDVMNSLPGYLRRDVGNCLSERYFNQLSIFADLSPYIRGLIALRLRCVSCNSDYELFHAQQYGKELFIQRTGVSYLLDQNKKLHKIKRGGVVGYYALLNPVRQTTLKCSSWCEFYALDRDDIQDILRSNFPRAWRPLWLKIKTRIKELFQENTATLNINIKRNKDITKSFEGFKETVEVNTVPKLVGVGTKSSASSGSMSSIETPRLRPTLSLKRFSTESMVVQRTVRVATSAKTGTKRKMKRLLQVSDSEMRDDKVLNKPPLNKLSKDKQLNCRYEKKLKSKMIKMRHKRELIGVDEIIPKFNNNKPMIEYFANIIQEEIEKDKEIEIEIDEAEDSQIYDDESMGWDGDDQNSEECDDYDDSDFESGACNGSKKRGASGIGSKRAAGGFKGMKRIKMNKGSKGIRSVGPKVKRKRKKTQNPKASIKMDTLSRSIINLNDFKYVKHHTEEEQVLNISEKQGLLDEESNKLRGINELQSVSS